MTKIPDVIYLQIEHDGEPADPSDWTHCVDRVNDSDVEYRRAPVCKHRKVPRFSYLVGRDDARRREKRKELQHFCNACRRWVWDEFWE